MHPGDFTPLLTPSLFWAAFKHYLGRSELTIHHLPPKWEGRGKDEVALQNCAHTCEGAFSDLMEENLDADGCRAAGSSQQESPGQELLHTHAKMHRCRGFLAHLQLCVGRTHTKGRPL